MKGWLQNMQNTKNNKVSFDVWIRRVRYAYKKMTELDAKYNEYYINYIGYKGVNYEKDYESGSPVSPYENINHWLDMMDQVEKEKKQYEPIMESLKAFKRRLTPREKEVLVLYNIEGHKASETAKKMGISVGRVYQIEKGFSTKWNN